MKHTLLTIFVFSLVLLSSAQPSQKVKLASDQSILKVTSFGFGGLEIANSISEIELINQQTKEGPFISISSDLLIKTFNPGYPDLPVISKLIEVPLGATVTFRIISYDEEIINLKDKEISQKIIPAQPSLSKSDDPEQTPFFFDEKIYSTDKFLNDKIAHYEESGFMRATRLGRVEIRPIQYNPVSNSLKILNNLVVEVVFENANREATETLQKKYSSPYFQKNTGSANQLRSKDLLTNTPISYVIVSDPMFAEILQPFIEWKRLKGFHVIEAYTNNSEVGNTTETIKNYLKNLFENPPTGVNSPTFGLLVGDVDQIPTFSGSATVGNHVSDLYYFEYTDDNLPEMYYGRFSAQNIAQLQPQIDKTLEYEKYLMSDPSYLTNQVLIAGVDATYAPVYGNGHIRYAHGYYSNEENGINAYTYLFNNAEESTTGIGSNQSTASAHFRGKISEGVSWANYTAHCGTSGWGDPSFSTSQIPNLTNAGKYGIWIGNCCQSNSFNVSECFGEAALRAENKGAIGYLGGSNNTYWDEDYYYGVGTGTPVTHPDYSNFGRGAYDVIFHTQDNEIDDPSTWFMTQGQLNVAGNLAVEASTSSRKVYYWEIYHLMGDPSLTPYLWVPEAIEVTLTPSVFIFGISSLNVSTVPYAQVALSQDGELLSVGITDATGNVELAFQPTAITPGNATLVITAQNHQPYIETILVTPANEPYIVLESFTTSNNPDSGKEVDLDIVMKNLSGEPYTASEVQATLTSSNPYITISNDSLDAGTITWGQAATFNQAFTFTIADSIPDQTPVIFTITISGKYGEEAYEWVQNFTIKSNAPAFSVESITIDDNDEGIPGILDPGETANAIISLTNTGHADAIDVSVVLASLSNYLTINSSSPVLIDLLEVGNSNDVIFSLTASDEAPLETIVHMNLDVESDDYSLSEDIELVIGAIPTYKMGSSDMVSACIGRFFDSGGVDHNYSDNELLTMTFYPGTVGKSLSFSFTLFDTESSWDFLSIYDGESTSSPLINVAYSGNNLPANFYATNEQGAITFKFTSDANTNNAGWSADFFCFDPGVAPSCASNPSPKVEEIVEYDPVTLKWENVVGATEYDVFIGKNQLSEEPVATISTNSYIHNLESNSSYFWKVVPKNNAGSASGCPVWTFSTGELTSIIKMFNGNITTCKAKFFDTGGEEGEYSINENLLLTIYPSDPSQRTVINFLEFSTEEEWDKMIVYNGTSTSDDIIETISGSTFPVKIKATNPEGALTIKFTSDGSVTGSGWSADVICESPTYQVAFEVVNPNNYPIEGAQVSLQGYSNLNTNSQGFATIQDVMPQVQVPYSISYQSFHLSEGTIDITNENVYRKIVLVPLDDPINILDNINVFPNPFDESISVSGIKNVKKITLTSVLGQELLNFTNSGQDKYSIFIPSLPSGIYFVTLQFNSGFKVVKKVVRK